MPPENEKNKLAELFKPAEEKFVPDAVTPEEEVLPEDLKNRHIRRLEAKLQSEREVSIAREARLEALSEAAKFRGETKADELEEMASRIYGNDKPENAAATELLLKSLKGFSERAKREAIEEFRVEQQSRESEVENEVQTLDGYIEQIEDQYGVDLSSTAAAREKRTQYFELLEKLSPKRNGEVVDYADPFETYELFASRQPQNRSRELASRGMTRSRPIDTTMKEDATAKFLKDQGLLEPF